jgi:hypothetical protein
MSDNLLNALAHPAQVNLLGAYQGANQVAQGIWANRLSQANQLSGQAQQDATAADGTYSPDQYRANLKAAGPGAALAAQSGLASNQVLSSDQLNQAKDKLRYVNDAAGSLTRLGDKLGPADVLSVFSEGLKSGMLTMPEVQKQMAGLPSDNAGLQAWAKQHQFQAMTTQQQLEQTYGTRQPVNSGGATSFPVVPPASAGGAGPVVPMTLTPGEAAQRVPTIDNNLYGPDGKTPNPNYGQPVTVPLGSVTPQAGGPSAGAPPPGPNNQPRLQPSAAVPSSGGKLATGLPPGGDIPIKAANDAWAAASADVNTYAQRSFPVTQALSLIKSGDVTTGQGAETINDLKSWLQTRASSFGWNAQTIANSKFQELGKYLQQNVNAMPMASGSDARLSSALAGTPNAHLNNLSLEDTLTATQGLMRMQHMAALDFAARGAPNGQWNNFMRDWQTSHDPRAFIFDGMDDAKRGKMIAGMTKTERSSFSRTLDLIEKNPDIMNTAAMPH